MEQLSKQIKWTNEEIAYLQLLQGIINRLATYSSVCKICAITVFTLVVSFSKIERIELLILLLCPMVLLYFTDAYYLGMERRFITFYRKTVNGVETGDFLEIFKIPKSTSCEQVCQTFSALCSLSTILYYPTLIIIMIAFNTLQ